MYFHRRQTCTKRLSTPKFVTCNLKSELKFFQPYTTQTNMKVRTLKSRNKHWLCYLQKNANCIDLQLAIRISKNQAFRTCTTPSRTFRPILRSIGLLDNELPRKENISTDDRRTDRRTDGQTSRTTTIGSFFEKRKNY